jgi:hypothetical protein
LPAGEPVTDDLSPSDEPDHRWLVRVWVLVAAVVIVTAARSYQVDVPPRDPHGAILLNRLGISVGLLALFAVLDASVRTARQGWSVGKAVGVLRARWTRGRLLLALNGLLAYYVLYFCYRNLKSWNVFNDPRDELLLDWDKWLFFGHSPAVLIHDLLGEHYAAYILTAVYVSFTALVPVAVVAALVFTERIRDGYVFITSAMWVWVLGAGSYYLIPTLGPFNSTPWEFSGLPHTAIQNSQDKYMAGRAHLLDQPGASDAFAQVQAFASLHVAATCMVLLMARYYGLRRISLVLGVYLFGTILATIYFGWHFVVDDFAGIAIAFLAVFLGRLMIYPRGLAPVSGTRSPA